eukprot:3175257-Pyramimonas_sp.AAC.1
MAPSFWGAPAAACSALSDGRSRASREKLEAPRAGASECTTISRCSASWTLSAQRSGGVIALALVNTLVIS